MDDVGGFCAGCARDLRAVIKVGELRGELALVASHAGGVEKGMTSLQRAIERVERRLTALEGAVRESSQPVAADRPSPPVPVAVEAAPETAAGERDEPPLRRQLDWGRSAEAEPPPAPREEQAARRKPELAPAARATFDTEVLFGQRGLLIAGLVILVLGVGYFLKYSFDHNWIGPAGRVGIAYAGGLLLLWIATRARSRGFEQFGLYLTGGASAVLYFAGFASYQLYDLVPQLVAFGGMVAVTAMTGTLAVRYDSKWLAVLGLIGGFLTPIMLSSGSANQVGLMSYMLALNVGVLYIASRKQWALLNWLGFTATWLIFTGWFLFHYSGTSFGTTVLFLNLFYLTYASVPFVYFFRRTEGPKRVRDFVLTVPNSMIALAYSYATIGDRFSDAAVAVPALAYAGLFFWAAWRLRSRHPGNGEPFVLLVALGSAFVAAAIPLALSANWITVFWAVQAAATMWAARRLSSSRIALCALMLLALAVGNWLFGILDGLHSFAGVLTVLSRYVTAAVVLASIVLSGRFADAHQSDFSTRRLSWWVFGAGLFLFANVEVGALFGQYAPAAQFAAISVLWTLFSVVLIVLGFKRDDRPVRLCALGLFAATVLKLFVLDMANVDTPFRILSFTVLGLVLVAASYMYHRHAKKGQERGRSYFFR